MSNHDIEVYFAPIEGGTHLRLVEKVNQEIRLKVNRNMAVFMENKNKHYASVDPKVTGDLNLGMAYNQ